MTPTTRRGFLKHLGAAAGATLLVPGLGGGAISAFAQAPAVPAAATPALLSPLALDVHAHLPLSRYGGPLAARFGRELHGGQEEGDASPELSSAVRADTFDALLEFHANEMRAWGVERSAVMQIDFGLNDAADTQWDEAVALAEAARHGSPRLLYFFGCDPRRGPVALERLERAVRELGARGVKVHSLAGFAFDDAEVCFPYYAKCRELGLPVLGHCRKLGLGPRDDLYRPERFGAVAAAFPELRVCMGHLGGPSWKDEALAQLEAHENLYGDLSFYQSMFTQDAESFFAFLRRVMDGPARGRVMFGTDWPNGRVETAAWLAAIRAGGTAAHPLGEEEVLMILRRNAEAFLGPAATSVSNDLKPKENRLWT